MSPGVEVQDSCPYAGGITDMAKEEASEMDLGLLPLGGELVCIITSMEAYSRYGVY